MVVGLVVGAGAGAGLVVVVAMAVVKNAMAMDLNVLAPCLACKLDHAHHQAASGVHLMGKFLGDPHGLLHLNVRSVHNETEVDLVVEVAASAAVVGVALVVEVVVLVVLRCPQAQQ